MSEFTTPDLPFSERKQTFFERQIEIITVLGSTRKLKLWKLGEFTAKKLRVYQQIEKFKAKEARPVQQGHDVIAELFPV